MNDRKDGQTPERLAFVLEYSLGHRTHADNLKRAVAAGDCGVFAAAPVAIDLPFEGQYGAWSRLPGFRSNWTLRASLAAMLALRSLRAAGVTAALFHTQVTAQFAGGFMRRVPSVVSLDATPVQMDALGAWYDHAADAPNSAAGTLKKRMTTATFAAASRLVAWSQWAKDSLVADYAVSADKVAVIPPGIDLARWDFGAARQPKPAGEPANLLFVGGDWERKGGDTLLAAWDSLPGAIRTGARLHLVTKTAPEGVAHQPNVQVYDDLAPNDPRLLALYARADLFVFPTRADCLPLAVMEACAAGLPVITTAIAALPEAVTDGANGLVVPPGDAPALADAVARLLTDGNTRRAMGRAARARAAERFCARANYRRLVDVVRGVAQ